MPERKDRRPLIKPSVNGIPALPGAVPPIDSPHIELLARVAVGGGVLTTLEMKEVCAAVVAHIEHKRRDQTPTKPEQTGREPVAAFYARMAADAGDDDIDLDAIVRDGRLPDPDGDL